MRYQRHLKIGLLFLLLVFLGQGVLAQTSQKRDLTRYDDGGSFDFNWGVGHEARERMNLEVRRFLWEHRELKRLGRVIATVYTLEGDPIAHTLYVEPDSNGRWRVVSEYEGYCCWLYALEKKRRKRELRRGVKIYDTVERVERVGDGKVTGRVIPEEESRAPDTYRLILRESNNFGDWALTF